MRALFSFRFAMTRLWDLSFGIHTVTSLYSQFLLSVTMKKIAGRVCVSFFNTVQTLPTLAVHVPEVAVQVGIESACGQLCMYIQGCPVEIRTPIHRNLIGRTTTALPVVLSPSSMLPPPSSHGVPRFSKKFIIFQLRNSGTVCTPYRSRLFCLYRRQVF